MRKKPFFSWGAKFRVFRGQTEDAKIKTKPMNISAEDSGAKFNSENFSLYSISFYIKARKLCFVENVTFS